MIHSYPNEYFELYTLAKDGFTFRQWNNEVRRLSMRIDDLDRRHKFIGDMLEVFAEIYFNVFNADEAIGITDYTPVEITDDFGVDATGVNVRGHNVAIQIKYRSNPSDLISYADIARTYTSALMQFNMSDIYEHDRTVYLFTNSNGVSGAFTKVMQNKVVVITNNEIKTKVDNNLTFWKSAYDMIFKTLDN
jgi:hypothetical protein